MTADREALSGSARPHAQLTDDCRTLEANARSARHQARPYSTSIAHASPANKSAITVDEASSQLDRIGISGEPAAGSLSYV
jgi:hypothetical protein